MKKSLAIANYRVSSDEQLKNNSLARQKNMCLDAIDSLGAELFQSWEGSVSSKKGNNVDRRDLQEMIDACKRNKNIKYAVFDELDRFMRSMLEIGYFLVLFKNLGVQVKFASQPDLRTDTAADTLMLMLEAFKAEGSNEERQRKSISGQVKALQDGRYTFAPKPGYKKGAASGIHEIDPVKGPALRKILIDVAYGRLSPSRGLVELNKGAFMSTGHSLYRMDKFRKIATDGYYAGIVEIDKQVKVRNVNGLHEPLLSLEEHQMLVSIFSGKQKNQKGPRKNGNPLFPVSNKVTCDSCKSATNGRFVGLELHNGKDSGKLYRKYRCRSCKRYISSDIMHDEVRKQFSGLSMASEGYKAVLEALDVVWAREELQSKQDVQRLEQRIGNLKRSINSRALAAIDPSNAVIKNEIIAEVAKNKDTLTELEKQYELLKLSRQNDKGEFMEFAYQFIENIGDNFLNADIVSPENRDRCKQIIFPDGFYLNADNQVYTPRISELYRLAAKKKDTEVSDNSLMVRVTGL